MAGKFGARRGTFSERRRRGGSVAYGTQRMIHMKSSWDDDAVVGNQAAWESSVSAVVAFRGSPQYDVLKTFNLDLYDYVNLFGETSDTYVNSNTYQLDSGGEDLYLPFGTPYARRSIDLRVEEYRAGWVQTCKDALADGAAGIFVDDVNLEHVKMFKRLDGSAPTIASTLDTTTYYNSAVATGEFGWKALMVDFLIDCIGRVRQTYPNAKFAFNTQVWWLRPDQWTHPTAIRMVQACNSVCLEFGFTDLGLTDAAGSDTGTGFAARSVARYVDMIHANGKAVWQYATQQPAGDGHNMAAANQYEMAWYLANRDPSVPDMIGIWNEGAAGISGYDAVFDTDFGARTSYSDPNTAGSTIVAEFESGTVTITPPASNTEKTLSHSSLTAGTPVGTDSWSDDFTSNTGNWYERVNASFGSFSIASGMLSASTTVNTRYYIGHTPSGILEGDEEIVAKVRSSSTTGFTAWVGLRGHATENTSYVASLVDGTSVKVWHYNNGAYASIDGSGDTYAYNWTANTWYWIRLGFTTGGVVRMKVWADGEAEPSSWLWQRTDPTPLSPGYASIGGVETGGTWDYDWVGIGQNGVSAPTVYRTATFETALIDTTSGYSNTGESSANAINSRDTALAYRGSASHKARHNGYTGSDGGTGIIRGNWYSPASATVHTNSVISIGETRWTGAAFYIRTGDTHAWTGLMRWSDYVTPEDVAKSLFEVTLESNTTLTVNLSDYGGSSTGVANRWAIHSTTLPRTNGWTYIELGSQVNSDGTGWSELWIDGVQIGSRITGRTIKLATHSFRHLQFGMGTYGLATNGTVNPAAEVNVDDIYFANYRRGSTPA